MIYIVNFTLAQWRKNRFHWDKLGINKTSDARFHLLKCLKEAIIIILFGLKEKEYVKILNLPYIPIGGCMPQH